MNNIVHPPKSQPGDKVAILSPSFAAPAVARKIHEQALRRFEELTKLIPVEFPTTRKLDASPEERAADFNAALADPEIRAIIVTIGGDDQITVVPHLDATLLRSDPKPFLGYSEQHQHRSVPRDGNLWSAGNDSRPNGSWLTLYATFGAGSACWALATWGSARQAKGARPLSTIAFLAGGALLVFLFMASENGNAILPMGWRMVCLSAAIYGVIAMLVAWLPVNGRIKA